MFQVLSVCFFSFFLCLNFPIAVAEEQLYNNSDLVNFSIAKSDAAIALNELAHQSDVVILFSYEQVSGRQANAIYGQFSLQDALKYLLNGTGLIAVVDGQNGVRITSVHENTSTEHNSLNINSALEEKNYPEIIKVAGIRRSMLKAQEVKKLSSSIMDVIVAEDIGKLPDITVAESMARLPGVQVTRFNDEASGILIRGLPYNATTYNGREIFTAELRRLQLQDMPSQLLSRVELYKPGTVDVIEPGLAGVVNVTARRPFDFEGRVIAGGLQESFNDQSNDIDPNGNLLYSDRWDTDIGQLGFLLNASVAQFNFYNGVRYASPWYSVAQPSWVISPSELDEGGFLYPANVGLYNSAGKRQRPSVITSFQWRPNNNTEFYIDTLYQGYRGEAVTDLFNISIAQSDPRFAPLILEDVQLIEGTNDQALSLTKSGGLPPEGYRSVSEDSTNTNQIGLGVIWTSDTYEVESDIAYTNSAYKNRSWNVDFALTQPQKIDVNFNTDSGVVFDLPEFNPLSIEQYLWRGYFEAASESQGDGLQWRSDVTYFTESDMFLKVQLGFRYTDRNASYASGSRYADTSQLGLPLNSLSLGNFQLTGNPYRGTSQGFSQFLAPTSVGIFNNRQTLRLATLSALDTLIIQNPELEELYSNRNSFASEEVARQPQTTYQANEKSYALYAQSHYETKIGNVETDGSLGLRFVKINKNIDGISTIYEGDILNPEAITKTDQYTDILPAITFRASFTETLFLRIGYAHSLTPVNFNLLNPALDIKLQESINSSGLSIDAIGSSGNPELNPLTSVNYDVSAEYYFSKTGFVSLNGFYRDLVGFPNQFRKIYEHPTYGKVEVERPENSDEGRLFGYEFNVQMFLDWLPTTWRGLGLSANTTYLKGTFRQADSLSQLSEPMQITGLSKWTYNLAMFYEADSLALRLSYNYRSPWINWYDPQTESGGFTGGKTRSRSRLDLAISYDINERYKLYIDVRNLLAAPFNNYYQYDDNRQYSIDVRDEGRYLGLGLRVNL